MEHAVVFSCRRAFGIRPFGIRPFGIRAIGRFVGFRQFAAGEFRISAEHPRFLGAFSFWRCPANRNLARERPAVVLRLPIVVDMDE